jgi:hypothetical protein
MRPFFENAINLSLTHLSSNPTSHGFFIWDSKLLWVGFLSTNG